MAKPARIIFGVLIAVVLLNLFLMGSPESIRMVVIGVMTTIPFIGLLYVCIRLNLKFHNLYFKMMAVSYGLELAVRAFLGLAGRAGYLYFPFLWWLDDLAIFVAAWAALLYRERWEGDQRIPAMERFSALVPAAKTFAFWLVLIGAPLALIAILRFLVYYRGIPYLFILYNNFAELLTVLTQTVTWALILLVVILNLSLFRIYRTQFFRYLYLISLATVIYSVVWRMFSLFTSWLAEPPGGPAKNHALAVLHYIGNFLNLLPAVYGMAVPMATFIVFLYYTESRQEETTPAP